jgi:arylsulfatase A-like enzyme
MPMRSHATREVSAALLFTAIILIPSVVDAATPTELPWQRGPDKPIAPPDQRPPNIVLILADDLGFNDVSFYNGGAADGTLMTPAIDRIGRDGVAFEAGYAGGATCAPSRAMLMTGRYPTRFGFEFTPTPDGMSASVVAAYERGPFLRKPQRTDVDPASVPPYDSLGMAVDEITMADVLREAGYHTVHIGKWHLGRDDQYRPEARGFDETLTKEGIMYAEEDDPNVVNERLEFDPIDQFLWRRGGLEHRFNGGPDFESPRYLTDWYTDEAVRVIELNRHRPFFLYLAHWAPHTPLQATREDFDALAHIEDRRLRVYAAMIRGLERGVARVLEALEENGISDDTLVIFSSDNGGAHYLGLPNVNKPFRGWKMTHFEGGVRVPYFMRWPAGLPAGVRYSHPVSQLDVFTTVAAAAGAAVPTDRVIDGVNLLPYLRGERNGAPHAALFWRQGHLRAVQANGWKLLTAERPRRVWLFDMNADPTQRRDLSAEHADVVAELRALIDAHDAEQAEPAWPSRVETPVSIDITLEDPQSPDDEFTYWPN